MKRHVADVRLWSNNSDADDPSQAYHLALYNNSESGATDSQVIENFLDDMWDCVQYVELDDFETGDTAIIYRR